ncbi:MAG: UbiX family flavin prenyltransferase [Gammaproteobacteria bacterium]|nr:UbiX family flavin prenyltransferase [Gammaproteobacteria bacterium]NIR82088.1 UbiX family flavin prenyltransferase [Gammaproteobacteria bacterium]NIR89321.1 UbiX family flavin prenyltransferase [Gammaproteobacteria bacterium]NIU03198.1 UbiX family flavin prenyltransferase [Gammaproteobacteria bacterium]NIV50710.1 UbiX family flavin prenyltransferase [Gammaproteobacteria bacterium]
MSDAAIALAMTGASGAPYGLRLLELLLAKGETVYLMVSSPGRMVIGMETPLRLPNRPSDMKMALVEHYGAESRQLRVFAMEDWSAPVASGSNPPRALVVCPCTTGTLAAIAAGYSRNLIDRAADVALKEDRKLILVPRETPFSAVHLENMLRLARLGAIILPPNPGFYHAPKSVEDLVDFVVARVLDHLGIGHTLVPRWGAPADD